MFAMRRRPRLSSSVQARSRALRRDRPAPSAPSSTFSKTVSSGKVATSWNVRTSPAEARRCGGQDVTSRPPRVTFPEVRGTKCETAFMNVVLPAPFGPIRPMISP